MPQQLDGDDVDRQSWHQLQGRDDGGHDAEGFLVAMAVDERARVRATA